MSAAMADICHEASQAAKNFCGKLNFALTVTLMLFREAALICDLPVLICSCKVGRCEERSNMGGHALAAHQLFRSSRDLFCLTHARWCLQAARLRSCWTTSSAAVPLHRASAW